MVDLSTHVFKDLNIGKITHKYSFNNDYVKEIYDPEHVHTTTKWLGVILDVKYEKADLQNVVETQCQHLIMTQHNELLKL